MLVDNIGIEQPKPSVRTCMGNLSINVHSIYFIRYVVTTQLVMSHNFSLILFSSVSLIFWLLIVAGCLKGPETNYRDSLKGSYVIGRILLLLSLKCYA